MPHRYDCPQCRTDETHTYPEGALQICSECDEVCERVELCETCEVRETCGAETQCLTCIAADAVADPSRIANLLTSTKVELVTQLAWQLYHASRRVTPVPVRLDVRQAG